ncbi:MAG: O-antigen ligase family protein [Bacteroidales bacterium]|nr:O-antigen ligase family protein [Bacteroidales bacterium]
MTKKRWQSALRFAIFFVTLAFVISTVFFIDRSIWQGVITAKYFWFAIAMCLVLSYWSVMLLFWKIKINLTDVILGLLMTYIELNYYVINGNPSMHWWLFLLMLPLYAMIRTTCANRQLKSLALDVILIAVMIEAFWGLLQLYGFTRSFHGLYKTTGSFFNPGPYSGFVAVGVPLALAYSLDTTLPAWKCWLGRITFLVALLVLPAAMSRAAWLAAIAGSAAVLIITYQLKIKNFVFSKLPTNTIRIAAVIVGGFLLAALLAGTYLMKKDSADGRWVIWQASTGIIKEHPLFGVGFGRFASEYGNAQAKYFLSGKGSEAQMMVADSPEYAFNEYVQMVVEIGWVGLALFMAVIVCVFCSGNGTQASKEKCALLAFLVFAAFSYPFSVLPLCILFVFLLGISASSSKFYFTLPAWLKVAGLIIILFITIYSSCQILPKKKAYREWMSFQMLYNSNGYGSVVDHYKKWHPFLKHEKQFLFEYGQSLSKTGQHIESNHIFEQYLHYGSDPMVYNCMGNNFKAMEEYQKAEEAYIRASQIVPNRHYPLYLLMKLYEETGQTDKSTDVAKILLEKPVKVMSTAIREMQLDAKQLIKGENIE